MYFSSNKSLYQDYLLVMATVNELDEEFLGLHLGGNDWEYPIWVMADRLDSSGVPGFIHIGVENDSQILGSNFDFIPKYVISTDNLHLSEIMQNTYETVIDTESIDLLVISADLD